ncbi:MAG: hypothetical protein V3V56_00860 [bacterium]
MVIEKLESIESSLRVVLEELEELRQTRSNLETQIEQARAEAKSVAEVTSGRDEELGRLREENSRLQGEREQVRNRVERILNHLPSR